MVDAEAMRLLEATNSELKRKARTRRPSESGLTPLTRARSRTEPASPVMPPQGLENEDLTVDMSAYPEEGAEAEQACEPGAGVGMEMKPGHLV